MRSRNHILAYGLVSLLAACTARAEIVYVDDGAPMGGDGSSWSTAFRYLQDALTEAASGDEIRVAGGLYKPDQSEGDDIEAGDREASFVVPVGVSVLGGYAGLSDPGAPNTVDIFTYGTDLSGDLLGNDEDQPASKTDNSEQLMFVVGSDPNAVISGMRFLAAEAVTGPAALSIFAGEVRACIFFDNHASNFGGAVRAWGPVHFEDCQFQENVGVDGGAIQAFEGVSFLNCSFILNTAASAIDLGGGGAAFVKPPVSFERCFFGENESATLGGAIQSPGFSGPIDINRCGFQLNLAAQAASISAIGATLSVRNSQFWSETGGAILLGGSGPETSSASIELSSFSECTPNAIEAENMTVYISNSIVRGTNLLLVGSPEDTVVNVSYSNVEGGVSGPGNIDLDPAFQGPGGGDLRLRSDSPCIDAGDPLYAATPGELDRGGLPRVVCARVDMGAFEDQECDQGGACCSNGTCQIVSDNAACLATGFVCNVQTNELPECGGVCGTTCFGDVNGDGTVSVADRGFVSANAGETDAALLCQYDLNGDGLISVQDRGFISANVGLCEPLPDYQNGSGLLNGAPDIRFALPVYLGDGSTCDPGVCD